MNKFLHRQSVGASNIRLFLIILCAIFTIELLSPCQSWAQSTDITVGGPVNYVYDPDAQTVQFSVASVQNSSATRTTGSLRLELWLSTSPNTGTTPSGSRIAVAPIVIPTSAHSQLAPGQSATNLSATVPATALPGIGTYYVSLVLSEYTLSCGTLDGYCADTYTNLPQQISISNTGTASAVQVFGSALYTYSPASGFELSLVSLSNSSSTNTTGPLRIEIWLTPAPYEGGAISGYRIGTVAASGVISPGGILNTAQSEVSLSNLPAVGSYYVSFLISEQTNACGSTDGYCLDSYILFPKRGTFGATLGSTTPVSLVAAVLPDSRSIQTGNTATVFATVINAGTAPATDCGIALDASTAASVGLAFQTSNSATNELTGSPNVPVTIPPGVAQSFVVSLIPTAAFDAATINLSFACTNTAAASIINGVDSIILSASATPVPDVISLTATASGDGIVDIPGALGTGAFAVATTNLGTSSAITVSADTGGAQTPITMNLCQTNPATGACISAIGPSVATTINTNETPTFAVFVTGTATVPFNPATSRIFVRFTDAGGVVRGASSVAVRTQ